MATRFYIPSTGAPPVSPAYGGVAGNWEDTSFAARLNLIEDTKSDTAMTTVADDVNIKTDQDHLYRQCTSIPITAQTISAQTVKFQMRAAESNAAANLFSAIEIRVVSNDGATVRGTILSLTRDDTEWVSALTNRQFSASTTQVISQANDRIVVEFGQGGDPTGGGNHNDGTMRIGDVAASDLPENDTGTDDYNPWVEFANTITFAITPTVILADTAALTANGQILDLVPGSVITVLDTAAILAGGQAISISMPGEVLRVDYEENDKTDHDSVVGDAEWAVNAGAALVGSYGAVGTHDGAGTDFYGVNNNIDINTSELRFRVYFEDVSLSLTNGDSFKFVDFLADGTVSSILDAIYITIEQPSGTKQIWAKADDDGGSAQETPADTLPSGPFYLEVLYTRASGVAALDGTLEMWIDGVSTGAAITDIDNWDVWASLTGVVWLGADSSDAGTSGDMRWDDFIVRDDDTVIGSAGDIISLSTASLTANGQVLTLVPGAVTTLLDTALMQANGQTLALLMGGVNIPLNTAQIVGNGQILALLMGETVVPLNSANLVAGGQAISFSMGEAVVPLSTAQVSVTGQVITISLVTLVSLNTAQLNANGQPVALVMGEVQIPLNTALLNANGQVLTVTLATLIQLLTASLNADGQTISLVPGEATTLLDTATLTADGQTLSLQMGESTIPVNTANLFANGQVVSMLMGETTIPLNTAQVFANGQIITLVVSGGPQTVPLFTAQITAEGQILSVVPGVVSILLDTAVAQANGEALTVVPGGVSVLLDTAQAFATGQVISVPPAVEAIVRAWTLQERGVDWDLENRNVDWTVEERKE